MTKGPGLVLLVRTRPGPPLCSQASSSVTGSRDARRASTSAGTSAGLPDLVVGVEGAGTQRAPGLARAHDSHRETHISAQRVVGDEREGLLGILGGLVLDLRRNDDALNRDCGTRHRLRPRQVSQDLLNIVVGQVLLDDRAQVLIAAIPPRTQLLGDVGRRFGSARSIAVGTSA